MAAFSGIYESPGPPPSGDVRGIVLLHCHGHQNGQQSGHILHRCFACCCPSSRWGNMEQVVAQWWRPVALAILHRAMPSVSHRRTAMAVKMANDRGMFVCCRRLFRLIKT